MKIKITKELKVKLLKALQVGEIDPEDFPELQWSNSLKDMTDKELETKVADLQRKLS